MDGSLPRVWLLSLPLGAATVLGEPAEDAEYDA